MIFVFPVTGWSQGKVFVAGTVGQYSMGMMKELQEEIQQEIEDENGNIILKPVSEFPVSLQIDAGYMVRVNDNVFAGGFANYAYTKGRLHYSDYSGETYIDLDVHRILAGAEWERELSHRFSFYAKLGFNYSMLRIVSYTGISNVGSSKESIDFQSFGGSTECGFGWTYTFLERFGLGIRAGYELNLQGKTYLKSDEEAYLQNKDGDPVRINWTGARAGLNLTYSF